MSKPVNARAIRMGDLVVPKDGFSDDVDVVKKVEIVLTLGRGVQDVYQVDEAVPFVEQEPLPDLSEEEVTRPDVPNVQFAPVVPLVDPVEPSVVTNAVPSGGRKRK